LAAAVMCLASTSHTYRTTAPGFWANAVPTSVPARPCR
jgi:hypothetical protein